MALNTPTGQPGQLQPGEFVSASHPSEVTFNLKNLAPPSNLYVRSEESLLLNYNSSAAALTQVEIDYRMILTNGQLQVGQVLIPAVNDRSNQFAFIPLQEGYLLNVMMTAFASPSVKRGQVYGRLCLTRGFSSPTHVNVATLFSGYVSNLNALGWPGGPQLSQVDGPGWVHSVQQANPAAGADWIYTVPSQSRQRIISLHSLLTTSATVANRNVQIAIDDGVNLVWFQSLSASIAASTTEDVSAGQTNVPNGVVTTVQSAVIPPSVVLAAGSRVRTLTQSLQAADQWSQIWLLLEEWIEPS